MQYAILGISSLALLCSAGTLVIMAKTAKDLKEKTDFVQGEVADVKSKFATNSQIVKDAIQKMEF